MVSIASLFHLSLLTFCVTCLTSAATAQIVPSPTPKANFPKTVHGLVHYGDVLDVDIIGSFEFDWRGNLTPEGFLNGLDKIPEQIFALCRSEADVAQDIEKALSAMLREPKVIVRIVDRSNRALARLDGAIRSPQRFQIKRPVRLNELMAFSGGITDKASGEITIFRPRDVSCPEPEPAGTDTNGRYVKAKQGDGPTTMNIAIADLLQGKAEANPEILSGDVISVLEAAPIYVTGGVSAPRLIPFRSTINVSRAIASAGGVSRDSDGTVTIFRRNAEGTEIIETTLKRIRSDEKEDVALKAFDIVDVGQKGREKKKTAPALLMAETVSKTGVPPIRVID